MCATCDGERVVKLKNGHTDGCPVCACVAESSYQLELVARQRLEFGAIVPRVRVEGKE
jgi:hypothetical protein